VAPVLVQPKRLALLVYLAVARPWVGHRRDTLLGMFWPDLDEGHGRSALRNALYFLRRALSPELIVNLGDAEISLDPALLHHDVATFEQALASGNLSHALDLYGGDFLRGFFLTGCPDFERWVAGERERFKEHACEAAWTLAGQHIEAGRLFQAERIARMATALVPSNEDAARSFMEALALAGDPTAALRFHDQFTALLQAEFELGSSPETAGLVDRIRRDEGRDRDTGWSHGGHALAAPQDTTRPSVAVLPFRTLGEGPDIDYFGLGVMDDVLARLSRVRGLRVVSRTSAMHFGMEKKAMPQIARELGVRSVVEGSVRRCGNRLRVVAQLIDGATDAHLWAESYDYDVGEVFLIQTDIAESIAVALQGELSKEDRQGVRRIPTDDLEAWGFFLRGVQSFQEMGPSDLAEALDCVKEAIRLDPRFAQAWALSAQIRILAGLSAADPPSAYVPKIRRAAARALDLDPQCGEAHAVMGVIALLYAWNPREAEKAFDRALALNPDNTLSLGWKSIFLTLTGRPHEAVAIARASVASDPLSAAAHVVLGQVLVMTDRLDEATAFLEPAIRHWPNALQLRVWLGLAYVSTGRPDAALHQYERAVEITGGLPHFEARRATALVPLGRAKEARGVLEALKERARREYVDPYSLFSVTLVTEGLEGAMPHLDEMLEVRSLFLPYLRAIPRFQDLRSHPAFQRVMERTWP
jgi:TolB-like protein/Tfp pilus assembly protein PilF